MKEIILSVPHSGTRTLAEHLGLQHYYYHFHQEVEIDADIIHLPVRDPLDHAVSWICFEGNLDQGGFFAQIDRLINFNHQNAIFHKIEELPVLKGLGPTRTHFLRKMAKRRDLTGLKKEIPVFFEWESMPEVRSFYDRFYADRWYRGQRS